MEGVAGVQREGGWIKAARRHFRGWVPRWDVFPARSNVEGDVTSFYISEFPDNCRAEDLFGLFGCIGSSVEVAIAPRRNKLGKRFGFARFSDVVDARGLGVKLDNVTFEGKKIHANIPRFERQGAGGGKQGRRVSSYTYAAREATANGPQVKPWGGIRYNGRSFCDVVNNVPRRDCLVETQTPVVCVSSKEEIERFSKAWVGQLSILGSGNSIQKSIERAGFFGVVVSPLGAKMCLLEEIEDGAMAEFLGEDDGWWKSWFVGMSKWSKEVVDVSRAVWIRVFGIPCLGWNSTVFSSVGNRIGKFICVDEATAGGRKLDVARIQVCSDFTSTIPKFLDLKLDGNTFRLVIEVEHQPVYSSVCSPGLTCESLSSDSIDSDECESWGDQMSMNCGNSLEHRGYDDDFIYEDQVVGDSVLDPVSVPSEAKSRDAPEPLNEDSAAESAAGTGKETARLGGAFDRAVLSVSSGGRKVRVSNHQQRASSVSEEGENSTVPCSLKRNQVLVHKKAKYRKVAEFGGNSKTKLLRKMKGMSSKGKFKKALKFNRSGVVTADTVEVLNDIDQGKVYSKNGGLSLGGDVSVSVGNQSESDYILANNLRQWKMVNDEDGQKLKSAIEALGVDCSKGRPPNGRKMEDGKGKEVVSVLSEKEFPLPLK
ncbi:uncharacterized protein LOC131629006 [Vicia villosa]|uniref:uncharacterized protein LOC131629006 n=1 Tax=Vicia villosa TaxID=3911 RepID=UPI00273C9F70|nr:uncharacterized protein LOC131629006 [Vicia villosa]